MTLSRTTPGRLKPSVMFGRSFNEMKCRCLQYLRQILYDVERIVRADAAYKSVTLQLDVPTALPTVIGNRTQLIEALMNLVLNALDSVCESADGPREVEMRASQPEAGRITVSVRDY